VLVDSGDLPLGKSALLLQDPGQPFWTDLFHGGDLCIHIFVHIVSLRLISSDAAWAPLAACPPVRRKNTGSTLPVAPGKDKLRPYGEKVARE
jgi:hypothetical protein